MVHELSQEPLVLRVIPARWREACHKAAVRHISEQHAEDAMFVLVKVLEQVESVVPMAVSIALFLVIFCGTHPDNTGELTFGFCALIFGLAMFLEGLRLSLMPLGEIAGLYFPNKFPMPVVMLFCFVLGALTTYAEPAINSLRFLSSALDPREAPLLWYLMNDWLELTIFFVGMGVGLGAMLNSVRIIHHWSLKPMIYCALVPTGCLTLYMQFGNTDLRPCIGLAYDAGAVTTGSVSVPILLGIGLGIASSLPASENSAMTSFGTVTLASILPITFVQILAVILSLVKSTEDIIKQAEESLAEPTPWSEQSPQAEFFYGLRSISPLTIFLIIMVALVLRVPLPRGPLSHELLQMQSRELSEKKQQEKAARSPSVHGQNANGLHPHEHRMPSLELDVEMKQHVLAQNGEASAADAQSPAASPATERLASLHDETEAHVVVFHGEDSADVASLFTAAVPDGSSAANRGNSRKVAPAAELTLQRRSSQRAKSHWQTLAKAVRAGVYRQQQQPRSLDRWLSVVLESRRDKAMNRIKELARLQKLAAKHRFRRSFWDYRLLLSGLLLAQLGIILINFGLSFGLTPLGGDGGSALPGLFLSTNVTSTASNGAVSWTEQPPRYSYGGGLFLVLLFVFALGVFATLAEPALAVLGNDVEQLSKGAFSKRLLVWAVSIGVGVGMCIGLLVVIFHADLTITAFLLPGYALAVALTLISEETVTNVAWDSAGVTTGDVTAPFVLAIGLNVALGAKAQQGFGILATASLAPIISVLLVNLILRKLCTRA